MHSNLLYSTWRACRVVAPFLAAVHFLVSPKVSRSTPIGSRHVTKDRAPDGCFAQITWPNLSPHALLATQPYPKTWSRQLNKPRDPLENMAMEAQVKERFNFGTTQQKSVFRPYRGKSLSKDPSWLLFFWGKTAPVLHANAWVALCVACRKRADARHDAHGVVTHWRLRLKELVASWIFARIFLPEIHLPDLGSRATRRCASCVLFGPSGGEKSDVEQSKPSLFFGPWWFQKKKAHTRHWRWKAELLKFGSKESLGWITWRRNVEKSNFWGRNPVND